MEYGIWYGYIREDKVKTENGRWINSEYRDMEPVVGQEDLLDRGQNMNKVKTENTWCRVDLLGRGQGMDKVETENTSCKRDLLGRGQGMDKVKTENT